MTRWAQSHTPDNTKLLKGLSVLQQCIESGLSEHSTIVDAFITAIAASQTHPHRLACVAPGHTHTLPTCLHHLLHQPQPPTLWPC